MKGIRVARSVHSVFPAPRHLAENHCPNFSHPARLYLPAHRTCPITRPALGHGSGSYRVTQLNRARAHRMWFLRMPAPLQNAVLKINARYLGCLAPVFSLSTISQMVFIHWRTQGRHSARSLLYLNYALRRGPEEG